MIEANAVLTLVHSHFKGINWDHAVDPGALVTADFVWCDCATADRFSGPQGYSDFLRRWWTAFPDLWLEVQTLSANPATAVCEYRLRGVHTGLLVLSAGVVPATGREIDLPVCEIYCACSGSFTGIHTYYDLATLLQQLDQMPGREQRPWSRFLAN